MRLPKRAELDELKKNLAASYELPWQAIELIKGMCARVPKDTDPMDMLRTVISALSFFDPEKRDLSREASIRERGTFPDQMFAATQNALSVMRLP